MASVITSFQLEEKLAGTPTRILLEPSESSTILGQEKIRVQSQLTNFKGIDQLSHYPQIRED